MTKPLQDKGYVAMAFRVTWRSNEDVIWKQILSQRVACDKFLKSMAGVSLFVSAITGAIGKSPNPAVKKMAYPGISYWIVPDSPNIDPWAILKEFQNALQGRAEIRFLREPPINTTLDLMHSTLCNVMKDHNNGYIEQRMADCQAENGNVYPYSGVSTRIVAKSDDLNMFATAAQRSMNTSGICVDVVTY